MDKTFWSLLTNYGTKVQIEKEVVLGGKYNENISHSVYLLEDGICALTSFTKQGEEKVYLYFHPRRIICFNQLMISKTAASLPGPEFTIITKTRCTLYRIAFNVFNDLVRHNADFNKFLIETLADNYNEALIHFHLMQEESVTSRLCRLLLDVSKAVGNNLIVPKFFTYAELAKYLGSHPVTVSRIMTRLKHHGYITRTASGIMVEQKDALQALIHSESCFKY